MFEKHQLKLYSITEEKLGPDKILTILIDNDELTHETLEPIHYEVLDEINDDIPDGYFLELSTVGLERELRNLEEVIQYTQIMSSLNPIVSSVMQHLMKWLIVHYM